MGDATLKVSDKPSLAKGSSADKLQHHDHGRLAELEVLRYELESQASRKAEIVDEIEKLVDHLGLDRNKVAADARARRMLGDSNVAVTPFVTGRARKGYTQIEVRSSSVRTSIVIGHPPRVHSVPATIEITARKP